MRIRSVGTLFSAAALTFAYGADADGAAAAPDASVTRSAAASPAPAPVQPPAPPGMQRRVDVEMRDSVFAPQTLEVRVGETIDFVFTDTGLLVRDAFIGDKAAQAQHEKEMREMKDGHDHAHAGGVTVPPGQTGAVRHRFECRGRSRSAAISPATMTQA